MNIRRAITQGLGLAVGAVASFAAYAIPTVSQDGLDITVGANTTGQTVSISFLLEVGDAATASSWVGTTMDALSIQFGCAGNNCNSIIESISSSASTSANVFGTWTGLQGKVSGNGCSEDGSEAVCYTRLESGDVNMASETVMQANTAYTFGFDVTFLAGVDVASVLTGDRSIKFLSLKQNPKNLKWTTGGQLSQEGSIGAPVTEVPEPGSLALLGGALLGLGLMRRRIASAA